MMRDVPFVIDLVPAVLPADDSNNPSSGKYYSWLVPHLHHGEFRIFDDFTPMSNGRYMLFGPCLEAHIRAISRSDRFSLTGKREIEMSEKCRASYHLDLEDFFTPAKINLDDLCVFAQMGEGKNPENIILPSERVSGILPADNSSSVKSGAFRDRVSGR